MSGFIVIAALLTLAVLAALLYPLLRRREGSPEAWRSGGLAALLIVAGAAALYPLWSNFKWQQPAPALDSPEAMVGRLARRLEKEPNDLDGWLLLGKSYGVIGQYSLSARAYQRADTLANNQSVEALLGLGEALLGQGSSDAGGRAGRLFERALELDGNSLKALFYGALAAQARNELPLAKQRFMRMLEGNPPPEARRVIENYIQELDAAAVMAAQPATAPAAGAAAQAAAVAVPVRVMLGATVKDKAAAGAPLFVVARVPGQRGPPLAAKRLAATFPQDVELLSTDAMIAGSGFAAGQEIEVEARIANGGGAISASGDPFGTVRLKAGSRDRVIIEINQLKP